MTDGQAPPSTQASDDNSAPYDPFMLEPVKAHSTTGPVPSRPSARNRGRARRPLVQPAFMALLLAVLVAVPTVLATLPGGGEPPEDRAAPQLNDPGTDANARDPRAYEDCVRTRPGLREDCAAALKSDSRAAARYLECRSAGLAPDRCLATLP